jgi:hypothetical protein
MKLIIVLYTISLFCIISCTSSGNQAKVAETGEKVEIPEVVKTNSCHVSTAGSINWEMRDGKYEASFTQNKMSNTIILLPDGTILKYKVKIDASQLPQKSQIMFPASLEKKSNGCDQNSEPKGMISYEIKVDTSFYMFAGDGLFVGKEDR